MNSRILRCLLTLFGICIILMVPAYFSLLKRGSIYVGVRDTSGSHRDDLSSTLHFLKHKENRTIAVSFADVIDGPYKCRHVHKLSQSEIHYRHKHWQVLQEGQEDIVVYSAFYDDRPIVGVLPWIRILGLRRLSDTPLWCYLWCSQTEMPLITNAEIIRTGANQRVKGGHIYSQNLFSCRLDTSDFVPTHVSIVTRLCANSTIFLEVTHLIKSDKFTHNFGACLEVNFGYFPPELIVEWMEAYSLFGVTHVNVYNGSIDSRLDRVFDYYSQKGVLELRQMPPAVEDYSKSGVRLGSPASLNDCMMRNMYSHRFIVVVDFDEIIVPRNHCNYLDMIKYIDESQNRSDSHHTYSFRNAYFFKFFPEDESEPKFLSTLRFRHRAPPSDYLFGGKSFVDPRQCKSIFNHYCWVRFPRSGSLSVDVDTSVALSHHYRTVCPFDKKQCEKYDKKKTVDNIMLRYKDYLLSRVSVVLNETGFM